MSAGLKLIKNSLADHERRVLPRFPFCYLTFKATGGTCDKVFEVPEMSESGMQLALREGEHDISTGSTLKGEIHFHGKKVSIEGKVRWTQPARLGIKFVENKSNLSKIKEFLSVRNLKSYIRPLHKTEMEFPKNLKCWLRTDGPLEVFAWNHPDGEYARFQFIMLDHFVEWIDGEGLRTGKVITKRDLDTPLITEDEFVFNMDTEVNENRTKMAAELLGQLGPELIEQETVDFIHLKLGV